MTKKSTTPKVNLPGKQFKIGEQTFRVLEGAFSPPGKTDFRVLAEVPGLVTWLGRVSAYDLDEKPNAKNGLVLDAFPIITAAEAGNELTETQAGIILLSDLSRDITVENRVKTANFTMGHVDDLEAHGLLTYGVITQEYIKRTFLSRQLGTDNARFLCRRLVRILKVNYPVAAPYLTADKARIVFTKGPFKCLATVPSGATAPTLLAFAKLLGQTWLTATAAIAGHDPTWLDRSHFFTLEEQNDADNASDQAA